MDVVSTDELRRRLDEPGLRLLDVRAAAEFEGRHGAPCDPRQGHIPGARNLDVHELAFMTPEQIRASLGPPAQGDVIAYCHSGNRSAVACSLLAAAGYRVSNYSGSWHEWSRDPALPIASGPG